MDARRLEGLALAAASGVLYGSINVLAKPVDVHPLWKGAIAYLVSALVLAPALLGHRVARRDWGKVLGMGLTGGALAPLLLFFGLREAAAADAGLLLTLELVATGVLAAVFLGERFDRREGAGLALLFAAAALIAWASGGDDRSESTLRGVLLVSAAAVAWGFDNTISAHLVGTYRPAALISMKGMIGGSVAIVAAIVAHVPTPGLHGGAAMAGIGVFSIALSSVCFYFALRFIGAGRTSAMNVATTAIVGAVGGALLLGETLHLLHGVAIAAVFGGAWLLAKHRATVPAGPG